MSWRGSLGRAVTGVVYIKQCSVNRVLLAGLCVLLAGEHGIVPSPPGNEVP